MARALVPAIAVCGAAAMAAAAAAIGPIAMAAG